MLAMWSEVLQIKDQKRVRISERKRISVASGLTCSTLGEVGRFLSGKFHYKQILPTSLPAKALFEKMQTGTQSLEAHNDNGDLFLKETYTFGRHGSVRLHSPSLVSDLAKENSKSSKTNLHFHLNRY